MLDRTGRTSAPRGIALLTVILVSLAVAAIGAGALMLTSNATLLTRYSDRTSVLETVADAGLEEFRSRLNGDRALYPDTGYRTLEDGVSVADAAGNTIPGVLRWGYAGPTGITSGQYGVVGTVVAVAQDRFGNRVVRREEVAQESFAKFAYFTDVEPANISFGGGDQIFGPVHTNDVLKIYSSGATFRGPVTTAQTISGKAYGTFRQGYTEHAAVIPMPRMADLTKLQTQAAAGSMMFTAPAGGSATQATMRIEFVALDLNGDGQATGPNEGFIRVYTSTNAAWVMADVPSDYATNRLRNSRNCGHYHADGTFVDAASHPASGPDSWTAAVSSATKRCYPGGSDSLFGGFRASDGTGTWMTWPGTASGLVSARPDGAYLFPITRTLNAGFKGVIYVNGNVALSGVVRGRVTVAATGNILIADDLVYATNPGAGTCSDALGLFAGGNVIVADNTLNSPVQPTSAANWFTYDDTKDEFIDAVVLTLNQFTVENYASGSTKAEPCENNLWGRGCLYLTGGIIQQQRGAVGTVTSPGGTGYLKRYSYDACAYTNPPPYFPTTGHFARGHYYEVDPTGFDIGHLFSLLTAGP